MHYISTRGNASNLDFAGVTLAGLASDGGLYVPGAWPALLRREIAAMRGLSYVDLAAKGDGALYCRQPDGGRTS